MKPPTIPLAACAPAPADLAQSVITPALPNPVVNQSSSGNFSGRPTDDLRMAGFHALSDPLRVQIIELLRHQELCVCELCDRLQVKQSKLSFHLKILKQAELIQGRQEGRWIYYRLDLRQFVALNAYLSGFCCGGTAFAAQHCP